MCIREEPGCLVNEWVHERKIGEVKERERERERLYKQKQTSCKQLSEKVSAS